MRIPSLRALAALLLALTMFAAACGGSDDDTETSSGDASSDSGSDDSGSDDSGDDDSGADDSGSDDADDSGDDDASSSGLSDDTPDEDDPATSGMVDDDDSDGGSFGGNEASFCAAYAENESLSDEFDLFDPSQVEAFMNMSRGLLQEAIGDAPGELVPDLQAILGGMDDMTSLLEEFEYDFFAAGEAVEALDTTEADAASDRIEAWIEANCPEALGDDDDEAGSLTDDLLTPDGLETILGSEAGRDLFIDGMAQGAGVTRDQAECLVDNLDVEMIAALATDPNSIGAEGAVDLLDVLSGCGIPLDAFG